MAGYFAKRAKPPLDIRPVSPKIDLPFLPFTFQISMGVRPDEKAFRDELSAIIERRQAEIDAILDEYAVPRDADPVVTPTAFKEEGSS